MELFDTGGVKKDISPLADAMRPETLDGFVGQEHIVGKGRLLRRAIQADQLSSLIFYGPPGTGKTTLARIIAKSTSSFFITINAVLAGVKEIREAISEAKERRERFNRRTILFVDEVHRWNKSQQDALLPWVENGTFIFIGATTENPSFEVNSALISRSRIFQLLPLSKEDLMKAARNAIEDKIRGYGKYRIEFDDGALEHIVSVAGGDARSMLNALQLAVETTPDKFPPPEGSVIRISLEIAEESIQKKALLYDKEGDYHYDTVSAFIKSLRGSDPDASLYWMARMLKAGEDPDFIFRRMMILASEDVGLADPLALGVVVSAAEAFRRVGMPEGQFFLSQAALYLACTEKSNSAMAYFDALDVVKNEEQYAVPSHLKDSSGDGKIFGHGEGYRYPHAFKDHWVAQRYLPDRLKGRVFYIPEGKGFEGRAAEKLAKRREAQLEAWFDTEGTTEEVLTFSPFDRKKEAWFRKTVSEKNHLLSSLREELFRSVSLQRHFKVLVPGNDMGLLAWEAARRVPEGSVTVFVKNRDEAEYFKNHPSVVPELERPIPEETTPEEYGKDPEFLFDMIMGRNIFTRDGKKRSAASFYRILEKGGKGVFAEIIPSYSSRLSEFILKSDLDEKAKKAFKECEDILYSDSSNSLMNWDEKTLIDALEKAGFKVQCSLKEFREKRFVLKKDVSSWFDIGGRNSYGKILYERYPAHLDRIREKANSILADASVGWKSVYAIIKIEKPEPLP